MEKTIKYLLLITLIAGFCLMVGGILFSVGHGKVRRADIKTYPKELIALQEYVKKELKRDIPEYEFQNCNAKLEIHLYVSNVSS
jgi:hypothetical protein